MTCLRPGASGDRVHAFRDHRTGLLKIVPRRIDRDLVEPEPRQLTERPAPGGYVADAHVPRDTQHGPERRHTRRAQLVDVLELARQIVDVEDVPGSQGKPAVAEPR